MSQLVFAVMLTFMGAQHLVPFSEFRVSNPIFDPNCPPIHLHAKSDDEVTAFDGTVIADPDVPNCGYGFLLAVPMGSFPGTGLPDADFDGIPDSLDNADNDPDENDNGVIDGLEDPDGDDVNTAVELNEAFTDPGVTDSDMDGIPDGIQYRKDLFDSEYHFIAMLSGAFVNASITTQAMSGNVDAANLLVRERHARLVDIGAMTGVLGGDNGDGDLGGAGERTGSRTAFGTWYDSNSQTGLYAGYAVDLGSDIGSPPAAMHWKLPYGFIEPDNDPDINAGYLSWVVGNTLGMKANPTGLATDLATYYDQGLDSEIRSNGLGNLSYSDEAWDGVLRLGFRYQWARTMRAGTTVTRRSDQYGHKSDTIGDATPAYLDIDEVSLEGEDGFDIKSARIQLAGTFPDTAGRWYVRIAWDLDNSALTGRTIGTAQGIDGEIVAEATRSGPGQPLGWGAAQISNGTRDLALPPRFREIGYRSPFSTQPTTASPGSALHVKVDFGKFTITPGLVAIPTYAFTQTDADLFTSSVQDQVDLPFFHMAYAQQPSVGYGGDYGGTLAPTGSLGGAVAAAAGAPLPGQDVNVTLARLTASTSFDLLVEDTNVLTDTTDAQGDYMGMFTVPAGLTPGNYFLTAVDATGAWAGSVLVVPEPAVGAAALASFGTLGLLRRARSRRVR